MQLPPLRDRGQDIIVLARFFLDQFSKENQMNKFKITPEAQNKLLKYPFPGNVRELKSVIELAAVMAENNEVREQDINFHSAAGDEASFTSRDDFARVHVSDHPKLFKQIRQQRFGSSSEA